MSAAFEAAERMESDAAAVRFRERAALPASASAASTPQGRASMIVRGMTRRGGSLRRSLKRLTIGGGGRKSEGSPSGKERVSIGQGGEEEWGNAAEILAEVRRNSDGEGDKRKSTWSKRYSTLRRSLGRRKKASKSVEPPPPDDAVTPGTCCAFSRRR